ncbi:Protein argonaute-3 [Halocaridina rubra]|uniref:Protein argonaute-3 n=1 Tax=Halocaridina rubra TaxID=373956 RepID=A0AAN9A9H6_HALRR
MLEPVLVTGNPKPPPKPLPGKEGRSINLITNFYEVKVKDLGKTLVLYDVVIKVFGKEEEAPRERKREIFEGLKKEHKNIFDKCHIAFDGVKQAVSVGRIRMIAEGVPYKVNVTCGHEAFVYEVVLKFANLRKLSSLRKYLKCKYGKRRDNSVEVASVLHLIHIMFRHSLMLNYIPLGQNSFFPWGTSPDFTSSSVGSGMQVERGYHAACRELHGLEEENQDHWRNGALLLNVNTKYTVFHKDQPVLKFMKDVNLISDNQNMNKKFPEEVRKSLEDKLKGKKVRVMYGYKRTYRVIGIPDKSAEDHRFEVQKKSKTVTQYMNERYEVQLKYPRLNLIQAAPEEKGVYLPLECCQLSEKQRVSEKLLSKEQKTMLIDFSAQAPRQKLNTVNKFVQINDFTKNQMMQSLEFTISDKPLEIKGRVLPPPELVMKKEREPYNFTPSKEGNWDVRDKEFYHAACIEHWGVVYFRKVDMTLIDSFVASLRRLGRQRGMSVSQPIKQLVDMKQLRKNLRSLKEEYPQLEILLIVLPSDDKQFYSRIKTIGDKDIGIVTQCVRYETVKYSNDAKVGKILFKVNAKMGGVNNTLQDIKYSTRILSSLGPVMIMGADVNHPPAVDKGDKVPTQPSIAAVVGSIDPHASKYFPVVRHQTPREEMILELEKMTKHLLTSVCKISNKPKPKRLILYRDGVSDSQISTILRFELQAIRDACTSLDKDYMPGITFIVVQKRHHTRFFPKNEKDGAGRQKNVPPGTVVDRYVTHPHDYDYYLCSQLGIKGTSRPAHYRVLWDDNNFSQDEIQGFTYALCHMYAPSSASISIPAPAHYAHQAALRGKVHLLGYKNEIGLQGEENHMLSDEELHSAVAMDDNNAMCKNMYYI